MISAQFAFPVPAYTSARPAASRAIELDQDQSDGSHFSRMLHEISENDAPRNDDWNTDSGTPGQRQNGNSSSNVIAARTTVDQTSLNMPALAELLGLPGARETLQKSGAGLLVKNESANASAPARANEKAAAVKNTVSPASADNLVVPSELQSALDDEPAANENSMDSSEHAGVCCNANSPEQSESGAAISATPDTAFSEPIAFAMFVTEDESSEGSANSPAATNGALASVAGNAAMLSIESPESSTAAHNGETQPNTLAVGVAPAEMAHNSETRSAEIEQAHSTQAPDAEALTEFRNEVVRNVHVELQTENNQRVDVRFLASNSELHVSVRSADANLTEALRNHMPQLTSRLNEQHFRAEVWIPRSAEASQSNARNSHSFDSPGGHTGGQGNPGRRQNGRQNDMPDSSSPNSSDNSIPAETTFKEITNPTWLL